MYIRSYRAKLRSTNISLEAAEAFKDGFYVCVFLCSGDFSRMPIQLMQVVLIGSSVYQLPSGSQLFGLGVLGEYLLLESCYAGKSSWGIFSSLLEIVQIPQNLGYDLLWKNSSNVLEVENILGHIRISGLLGFLFGKIEMSISIFLDICICCDRRWSVHLTGLNHFLVCFLSFSCIFVC